MGSLQRKFLIVFVTLSFIIVAGPAQTKDGRKTSTEQKMEEVGSDIKRGSSRAGRKIKDSTCEMFNGKMECAGKKAKHSIQNTTDKIEDKLD